jgi:hypothetical protein
MESVSAPAVIATCGIALSSLVGTGSFVATYLPMVVVTLWLLVPLGDNDDARVTWAMVYWLHPVYWVFWHCSLQYATSLIAIRVNNRAQVLASFAITICFDVLLVWRMYEEDTQLGQQLGFNTLGLAPALLFIILLIVFHYRKWFPEGGPGVAQTLRTTMAARFGLCQKEDEEEGQSKPARRVHVGNLGPGEGNEGKEVAVVVDRSAFHVQGVRERLRETGGRARDSHRFSLSLVEREKSGMDKFLVALAHQEGENHAKGEDNVSLWTSGPAQASDCEGTGVGVFILTLLMLAGFAVFAFNQTFSYLYFELGASSAHYSIVFMVVFFLVHMLFRTCAGKLVDFFMLIDKKEGAGPLPEGRKQGSGSYFQAQNLSYFIFYICQLFYFTFYRFLFTRVRSDVVFVVNVSVVFGLAITVQVLQFTKPYRNALLYLGVGGRRLCTHEEYVEIKCVQLHLTKVAETYSFILYIWLFFFLRISTNADFFPLLSGTTDAEFADIFYFALFLHLADVAKNRILHVYVLRISGIDFEVLGRKVFASKSFTVLAIMFTIHISMDVVLFFLARTLDAPL